MVAMMIGLSATGRAAGVGMRLAAARRRQRKFRRALGLPVGAARLY